MIIRTNLLLPGFLGMTLYPFIFFRKGRKIKDVDINHEKIHLEQQKEMLIIFFYLWYLIEWLVRVVFRSSVAYRGLSFEREAYENRDNLNYLSSRKRYAWLRYIKK